MKSLLALLLLCAVSVRAEEKPWLVFSVSRSALFTSYREIVVYSDGRVAGGGQLSSARMARLAALLKHLNLRGLLHEGAGLGRRVAHGSCTRPSVAKSLIWRPGPKAFSTASEAAPFWPRAHRETKALLNAIRRQLPEPN